MQIAPPIDALQHVPKKRGDVVNVERGIVLAGHDPQIFGQRQLPLPQHGVGQRQQFGRTLALGIGNVAFAADGQQQRMHARGVDGMDRVQARHDGREWPARSARGSIGRRSCLLAAAGRRR